MKSFKYAFPIFLLFILSCGMEVEKKNFSDFDNTSNLNGEVEYYAGLISNNFAYVVIEGISATIYYSNPPGSSECYGINRDFRYDKTSTAIVLWHKDDEPVNAKMSMTSYWESNYENFKQSVDLCI